MTNIDITELLENHVSLLERSGIPRTTIQNKLMIEAVKEIERLRKSVEFYMAESNRNNESRLRLQGVILNAMCLYEATCKRIRECTVETYVCDMCRWRCDTRKTDTGDYMQECPGFEKDDCFELDVNKFNKIIFRKDEQK